MLPRATGRIGRKHIFVCLLLLLALLGMSTAAASHIHQQSDIHEGQCALCMSFVQMVATGVALMVAFLLALMKDEPFFERESEIFAAWIPPAQRVRPPPSV